MRVLTFATLTVCVVLIGCASSSPESPDLSATVEASVQATMEVATVVAESVQATIEARENVSATPTSMPPTATENSVPTQSLLPSETMAPVATPTQQVYMLPTVSTGKTPIPRPTPIRHGSRDAFEYYHEGYEQRSSAGGNHKQSVSFADDYVEARMGGGSREFGLAYASAVEQGLTEDLARVVGTTYSLEFDRLRESGASHEDADARASEFASLYVSAVSSGYSDDAAELYAVMFFELVEAGLPRDDAEPIARTYAGTFLAATYAGYSREDAISLAQSSVESEVSDAANLPGRQSDENQENETAMEVSLAEMVKDYLANAVRADAKLMTPHFLFRAESPR